MELGLKGRVALVTGASKGLGLGTARALAAEGARVAVSSRSLERARAAAVTIQGGAVAAEHDARDVDGVPALVERVTRELGPIEIVVANSGGPPAATASLTHAQWRDSYELLLLGQLALIEAVLPGMRERGWGRVLSLSSTVVREPSPLLVLSAAHRAGLLAALKTIASEVGRDGVTVNTLLPGLIDTDRVRELGSGTPERIATLPAGRLGTVAEFGAAAAFLCSEPAAYITGTTLVIDGGASRSV